MDDAAIAALRGIADPLERAQRAHDMFLLADAARRIRDDAIAALAATGTKATDIATALGISRARVSQILKEGPPPERAWWGSADCVTVAVGRKIEAPKDASGEPGPVIAVEDAIARDLLRDSLTEMGLRTCNEEIAPPGFVDLNRDGLVVICGPRLSPMVGQILASDQMLGFGHDTGGWYLTAKHSGEIWRSPLDEGKAADIGYLGRLRRPDGQGTFIYIAGIHAAGAPGVVHWLTAGGGLAEVWDAVRDKRFSTLIACTFDEATRGILASERVTPLYRQEP